MADLRVIAIYGASGLGREVLELATTINAENEIWSKFIFVDDGDVPEIVSGCKVYRYEDAKDEFGASLVFAMGVGEPATRERLFAKIRDDGLSIATLVHPLVHVPSSTVVGEGAIIQYGCFVSCNVSIGRDVLLQPHCNVGHDCVLLDGCVISGFANLAGGVRIGRCTYVGMSAAVRELVSVGDYSIVGMGSMVHKDIADNVIAMGNPARAMAKNESHRVFKG